MEVILFPRNKEGCIADREARGNYCWSRLAVVSLVSLDLEGGCVDLSVAVGGTKDYSYHSGLAEDAIGRKVSLIYPNTFISAPKEFPYRILSVRGWAKNSGIGVVPELKKKDGKSLS